MDLKELRQLLAAEGGKIIIVEDERPVCVITSYEEYMNRGQKNERRKEDPKPSFKETNTERREEEKGVGDYTGELTIDDLPV